MDKHLDNYLQRQRLVRGRAAKLDRHSTANSGRSIRTFPIASVNQREKLQQTARNMHVSYPRLAARRAAVEVLSALSPRAEDGGSGTGYGTKHVTKLLPEPSKERRIFEKVGRAVGI